MLIALSSQERQDLLIFHENDVDMSDPPWVDEGQALPRIPPCPACYFHSFTVL